MFLPRVRSPRRARVMQVDGSSCSRCNHEMLWHGSRAGAAHFCEFWAGERKKSTLDVRPQRARNGPNSQPARLDERATSPSNRRPARALGAPWSAPGTRRSPLSLAHRELSRACVCSSRGTRSSPLRSIARSPSARLSLGHDVHAAAQAAWQELRGVERQHTAASTRGPRPFGAAHHGAQH